MDAGDFLDLSRKEQIKWMKGASTDQMTEMLGQFLNDDLGNFELGEIWDMCMDGCTGIRELNREQLEERLSRYLNEPEDEPDIDPEATDVQG